MNFLKQTKKDNCLVTCACMILNLSDIPDIKTIPEVYNFAYEKGWLVHTCLLDYETDLIGQTTLDDFVLRKLMLTYPGIVLLKNHHCYAHKDDIFINPSTGLLTKLDFDLVEGYLAFHKIKSTKKSKKSS